MRWSTVTGNRVREHSLWKKTQMEEAEAEVVVEQPPIIH